MNSCTTTASFLHFPCKTQSRTLDCPEGLFCTDRVRTFGALEKPQLLPLTSSKRCMTITMRDRSKNRKPLQRGRISLEAIQTVQALKRSKKDSILLEKVFESKVRRLVKADMVAVLRDLQRQNEAILALQVFEDMRREYWYKPKVLIYADMISVLATDGLLEKVELLCLYLKMENQLVADTESFNALLRTLMEFGCTKLAMECSHLMKSIGCDPDESTYRILICGLEAKGEANLSATLRQEAEQYFGWPIELQEEEQLILTQQRRISAEKFLSN